ncbi:MAG: hypothetical protein M1837_002599 [Sclerophora amabilis]|nr:MAG: hypothetical protein M1837_002599 [Sclerophora amabilis]
MPYPFALPTTSSISFSAYFSSTTHPSLPLTATTYRGVLRDVLKKHKRLPTHLQAQNVSTVLAAINDYVPYLLALDAGLSGATVAGEEVDTILAKEPELEWRATLTNSVPGREPPRVKLRSLEYEVFFVLSVLAYTYTLLARSQLVKLFPPSTPTAGQRTTAVQTATKYLSQSSSIHRYLVDRSGQWEQPSPVLDISTPVLNALASLSLAEATLLAVQKDDPYPTVVNQERNKDDTEWMIKAPEIPKVRAHVFARLCQAAADHAGKASAMLRGINRIDEGLVRYVEDLQKTARAKACRFLGIDADLGGRAGEAIAWLRGGKVELGIAVAGDEDGTRSGLSKWKKQWTEKREDKKIEQGKEWGLDAGRVEEGRVLAMLEKKWVKINDTINTQLIPPSGVLVASMPSGRDIHTLTPFIAPHLGEEILTKMRAPPDPSLRGFEGDEDDSDNDDINDHGRNPPGTFPGSGGGTNSSSVYY